MVIQLCVFIRPTAVLIYTETDHRIRPFGESIILVWLQREYVSIPFLACNGSPRIGQLACAGSLFFTLGDIAFHLRPVNIPRIDHVLLR